MERDESPNEDLEVFLPDLGKIPVEYKLEMLFDDL